ncbi:hypothetical protein NMY22_g18618 [Coprinellus aureogranulatus]|nr:hypothetical protein NMY22_g18618 [Coprinellus aureogranulatus]
MLREIARLHRKAPIAHWMDSDDRTTIDTQSRSIGARTGYEGVGYFVQNFEVWVFVTCVLLTDEQRGVAAVHGLETLSRLPRQRRLIPIKNASSALELSSSSTSTPSSSASTCGSNKLKHSRDNVGHDDNGEGQDGVEGLAPWPMEIAALSTASHPTRIQTVSGAGKPPLNPMTKLNSGCRAVPDGSTSSNGLGPSKVPTLSSSKFGVPKTVAKPRVSETARGAEPPSTIAARIGTTPTWTTSTSTFNTTGPVLRSATPNKKLPSLPRTLAAQLAARQALLAHPLTSPAPSSHSFPYQPLQGAVGRSGWGGIASVRAWTFGGHFGCETLGLGGRKKAEREGEVRRREREMKEVSEDLRVTRNELERERGATAQRRLTLANQAPALLSLTQSKVKMRKEVLEGEAIRKKLHHTILELKGNIRVFARVWSVLTSDLPLRNGPGSAARIEEIDEEEVEKVKAKFAFPDQEEHKDIVLYSTSESAMGNERKEVYTFGFDRVCISSLCLSLSLSLLSSFFSFALYPLPLLPYPPSFLRSSPPPPQLKPEGNQKECKADRVYLILRSLSHIRHN